MKNLVIEIRSQTASFRDPEFQNFHKTLDLPPPTTIIGLAGAAMGLSPLQAQEFFESDKIKIGICGSHEGKCSDTWKYNRRTNEMWKYNPEMDGSVIQKEFLIKNSFFIAFSSSSDQILEALFSGFSSPVFALTMGNSDSLAFVKAIHHDVQTGKSSEVEDCIVEGDIINEVMRLAPEKMVFSIYQTSEPISYDLPTRFDYDGDYGKRSVSSLSVYSFVGKKMKLNYELEGLRHNDLFIPLISI